MSLTTGFSTHCWRRSKPLALLGLVLFCVLAGAPRAENIVARSAQLELDEDSYRLNADFDVELTPTLEDALARGVPLYFVLELDVWRERNWWFDKLVVNSKHTRKLSYNALTRQYRLASGGLYQNFFQLGEALRVLGRVRGSPRVERKLLRRNRNHQAQVRMSLDASQLPSLFQLDALASPDWHLKVVAYSWSIAP
jgi:Domain of unknown function (DUF4390)